MSQLQFTSNPIFSNSKLCNSHSHSQTPSGPPLLTLPMPCMHIVSNTTSVSTFCHTFLYKNFWRWVQRSGSCSKAKWNLTTSKLFTSDVHENTYFTPYNRSFFISRVSLWVCSFHHKSEFWSTLYFCKTLYNIPCHSHVLWTMDQFVIMSGLQGEAVGVEGGGVGLRDRSILQRWQFCFRGWGHPIYPTTINFLFLSHLIEVPGLAEPWYVMTPL